MWDMSRIVKGSPDLTAAFDEGASGLYERLRAMAEAGNPSAEDFWKLFGSFIERFGARGPNEWELRSRTWGIDPDTPSRRSTACASPRHRVAAGAHRSSGHRAARPPRTSSASWSPATRRPLGHVRGRAPLRSPLQRRVGSARRPTTSSSCTRCGSAAPRARPPGGRARAPREPRADLHVRRQRARRLRGTSRRLLARSPRSATRDSTSSCGTSSPRS